MGRLFYVAFAVLKRAIWILLLGGERSESTQWIVVDVGRTGVGLLFAFLPLCDLGGPSVGRADITRTEVNLCLSHLWRGNFAAPHESRLVTL